MLYMTTRNDREVYTAQRVLETAAGPEGGRFLPYRHPKMPRQTFEALAKKPFAGRIAWMLNHLFGSQCSLWDVEFAVGRSPVRLVSLGSRLYLALTWFNPGWDYDTMAASLARLLGVEKPAGWVRIALRASVLMGICTELCNLGVTNPAISVLSGDFSAPIGAFYARQWGAPIGEILCCCNENNEIWNLFSHGQMRTDGVSVPTILPQADVVVPPELERLVYEAGGCDEVARYLDCCRRGAAYAPCDEVLSKLRQGLAVSVVSSERTLQTISGVYRTCGHILDPAGALAYAGLMDYRARTGRAGWAVILSDTSPRHSLDITAKALGMTQKELENRII